MTRTTPDGAIPGEPLHRGQATEDADYERVVDRMQKHELDDWPNEAGFVGLTEVRGPVQLSIKGMIPSWAAGTLYRTGPGEFEVQDTPSGTHYVTHWFDGFGQSHKFDIIPDLTNSASPVRVEYSSRRQTQGLVEEIRKHGHRLGFSFGQRRDPCVGLFGKIMAVWRVPKQQPSLHHDNVSVTVQANIPGLSSQAKHIGQSGHRAGIKSIWLTTDNTVLKEVDQDTLEPIGMAEQKNLHPDLTGPGSCAHAQRDPETGDMFNFNMEFGRRPTYRVFRVNAATGTTDILATICRWDIKPAYIHSFFLSPSFAILCIPSTHYSLYGLKVVWERNLLDAIEPFDKSKVCKWFVVDRRGNKGVVASFESPAGFFFHSVNSFEDRDPTTGDTILNCDVMEYPTLDILRAFEVDVILNRNGMRQNFWGDKDCSRGSIIRLARYKFRIPGAADEKRSMTYGTPERVFQIKAPRVGELPTINPLYATKKYRYVYSLPNRGLSTLLDSIVKLDLETREALYWDNSKGHTPGEAIFVPRPPTYEGEELAEDDGVLLSVVLDGTGKTSYLLCLDAKTMKELARAECEWAIAMGFHGMHAPRQSVKL